MAGSLEPPKVFRAALNTPCYLLYANTIRQVTDSRTSVTIKNVLICGGKVRAFGDAKSAPERSANCQRLPRGRSGRFIVSFAKRQYRNITISQYINQTPVIMKKQPKFIAICAPKGGVGKSTLTVLTASWLHYRTPCRVAVVDAERPANCQRLPAAAN